MINLFMIHIASAFSSPANLLETGRKAGLGSSVFDMGKLICPEIEQRFGLDFMGLLMVLVLALTLMVICVPPPRSRRYMVTAYRVC